VIIVNPGLKNIVEDRSGKTEIGHQWIRKGQWRGKLRLKNAVKNRITR